MTSYPVLIAQHRGWKAAHERLMGTRPRHLPSRAALPPPKEEEPVAEKCTPELTPLWRAIVDEVCTAHGVPAAALLDGSRHKEIKAARDAICFELSTRTAMTLPEMALRLRVSVGSVQRALRRQRRRENIASGVIHHRNTQILELRAAGLSYSQVAHRVGVTRSVVSAVIRSRRIRDEANK